MSSSPSSIWPDKATRDKGWEKIMADPEMQPGAQPMPFDGKRMFWGGFKPYRHARRSVTGASERLTQEDEHDRVPNEPRRR